MSKERTRNAADLAVIQALEAGYGKAKIAPADAKRLQLRSEELTGNVLEVLKKMTRAYNSSVAVEFKGASYGYLSLLLSPGYEADEWAIDVVRRISVISARKKFNLVPLCLSDLGNPNSHEKLCEAGIRFGYELCPPEVGLAVFFNQNKDERVGIIAMEYIADSRGCKGVFKIGHSPRHSYLVRQVGIDWRERYLFVRLKIGWSAVGESRPLFFIHWGRPPLFLLPDTGSTWRRWRT
jgi:hypothetical protein